MPLKFDLLEPGLGLSGAPVSASDLEDTPFGGILNVCDFQPPRYQHGLRSSIELIRRPINDIYPIPLPYLTLATLELAQLRQRGITTLVHCQAGRSRSPSVVALYWMARDNLTWNDAVTRVRARREIVEPNQFFASDRRRSFVVGSVGQFLTGKYSVLETARQERENLIRSFQQREPNPTEENDSWDLIEAGLAIGSLGASLESLAKHEIRNIILVANMGENELPFNGSKEIVFNTHRLNHVESMDSAHVAAIVNDIRETRNVGKGVCVLSTGDEFAGMFVMSAYLMLDRGWDIGSAVWYVGSRRPTIWTHVTKLWSTDWESLLGSVEKLNTGEPTES